MTICIGDELVNYHHILFANCVNTLPTCYITVNKYTVRIIIKKGLTASFGRISDKDDRFLHVDSGAVTGGTVYARQLAAVLAD